MQPPEDPEARIRDLEQPLGAPPTWPPPTDMPGGGSDRRGWVSNLLLGAGLLICAGVLVAYLFVGRTVRPEVAPTQPNAAVPSAARITPPERTSWQAPLPPTVPEQPSTATADSKVSVSGIEENRTVGCDGGTVEISGIQNTVVITGRCAQVSVSGIENVVTVDAADAIAASGIGNRVTFHSGAPQIETSNDNEVAQG